MPRQATQNIAAAAPKAPARNKPRDPVASGDRDAAVNRMASHNYFLSDKNGEAFLLNAHIGPYSHGNAANHDSLRTRKLLLHSEELKKLEGKTQQKGLTLIPTRLYFRRGKVKCELAIAKGKQDWDKRETERKREADREAKSAIDASKRKNQK
jgi:SsrA-binding protein